MTAGSLSLPRAVVRADALREAARSAVGSGRRLADLRGDAYGHGLRDVARTITEVGVTQVLVDDALCDDLLADGIPAVAAGAPDITPAQLYGLPGSGIAPAMSLIGQVMSTKRLRAGDAVSYGYTYRAAQDTTVALVTGGYAQGIVRALGNRARVEVDGALHPIVGRVAMDVCVVDVGAEVEEGTDAVYFGGQGPARDELARWTQITGLRAAELVTATGLKAVRRWVR